MFFVKGVEAPLTLDSLECVIREIAPLSSANPLFRPDGSFSGTVLVVLESEKDMNHTMQELSCINIDGIEITCSVFDSEYQEKNQRNCFVRNIPLTWSDDDLLRYCMRFGDVDSAKLRKHGEGARSAEGTGSMERTRLGEGTRSAEGTRSMERTRSAEGTRSGEGTRSVERTKPTKQCGYVSFIDYKVAKRIIEDSAEERFNNVFIDSYLKIRIQNIFYFPAS